MIALCWGNFCRHEFTDGALPKIFAQGRGGVEEAGPYRLEPDTGNLRIDFEGMVPFCVYDCLCDLLHERVAALREGADPEEWMREMVVETWVEEERLEMRRFLRRLRGATHEMQTPGPDPLLELLQRTLSGHKVSSVKSSRCE